MSEGVAERVAPVVGGGPRLFGHPDLDTTQIVRGLLHQFEHEMHRIVFWSDPEREFTEVVDSLPLDGVTILRLDEILALAVKVQIERSDPVGRYLLYAPFVEPRPENDWLLDVRVYGGSFRADRASILLAELGLGQSQFLRGHISERSRFLGNKDRLARLTRLVREGDDAADLDRKMLSVLIRSEQPEPFTILVTLFHDLARQDGGLDGTPSTWDDIIKFGLIEPFWAMVAETFGYQEDQPKLRNLLIRLLTSDFANSIDATLPTALQHHVLPKPYLTNVVVFLNQWRDSATRGESYDCLSAAVAEALHLGDHLEGLAAEQLVGSMTFLQIEKRVASELRDRIIESTDVLDAENIKTIAARRQEGHWASRTLSSSLGVPREAFSSIYTALGAAVDLLVLVAQHQRGFSFKSAKAMYAAYESELYRFDQLYRHFCECADVAHAQGWDILKLLREKVEAAYDNGYIVPLGLAWGEFVERDLLADWDIEGVDNQHQFYQAQVRPVLDRGDIRRVFVIISDAFRYEAAKELTAELNGKFRFRAELSSQLGVLPSYTALGMAALLPHHKLEYGAKGEVLIDGRSTSGLENRAAILGSIEGMAVAADTLVGMKKDEGRAFIRDHRVIYIYHNTVDATGDSASTEDETFGAVRRAIDELANLVRQIINSLNGSYVIITADHGFLFQERAPNLTDKSVLAEKPVGTLRAKKRYLLGRQLPQDDKVYHGTTAVTANAVGDMEFWLPKGANRFHFTGGARFIHGGALLQEVVVPVITVRELEGGAAESTKTKQVAVHVLGANLKVTTHRYRVQLIQTEAVSERVKPICLQLALYDGEKPITNVETVTFDSSSSDVNDRTRSIPLSLKTQNYDRRKTYSLILRNVDDNIEHQRVDVTVDLAFSDDF